MNPRQNFYSSVFEQIMSYKKEKEFGEPKNFFHDPIVGLGLFATFLIAGLFSGYVPGVPNLFEKTSQLAQFPIIKTEQRAAADIFSPDKSNAAENDEVATNASLVLVPSEDGYVSSDSPRKAYGSEGFLKVENNPSRIAFLKFKVPDDQTFSKVQLRLVPKDTNDNGGVLSILNDNLWSEKLLTFDARPTEGEVRVGPIGAVRTRVPKLIDVTNYVVAGKTYTFKVLTEATEGVSYISREASTDTSPALLFSE